MATNQNKKATTTGKGGGGAKGTGTGAGTGAGTATALAMPEGYTTGKNKFYADEVARRFDMLPPKGGVVRILLLASKDANDEQVRTLLGNPRYTLKMRAPGVYEATVMPRDMELTVGPNVGAEKTFRWVDLAHRFYGIPVGNTGDTATLSVMWDGPMTEGTKKLKSLGMNVTEPPKAPEGTGPGEWVDPDEGHVVGTMPAAKLYDLVLQPKALAIEVRSVTTAGAGAGAGTGTGTKKN